MTLRRPRALAPGDRVAVLAPASPFDRAVFEQGLTELRELGFDPVFDESVFGRHGYVAGPAPDRAASLRAAWRDPDVAGIFAVRGGYGSAQLLPLLNAAEVRQARKVFVGCSDLTTLLVYHAICCETVSFHGPMLVNLARREEGYVRRSLLAAVTNAAPMGELTHPGLEALTAGEARGPLLGGTLTQLLASLATPFAFDPPPGYVLFLEDVGEKPYRIDRMLTQARQAGWLARASAIVCGEFVGCDDPAGGDARSVVTEILREFSGPVLYGFASGHTAGPTLTLPIGVDATVTTTPRPRVIIEEAAVE